MNRKKVYQFNRSGERIDEFDYAKQAGEALGIPSTYVSRSAYRGDLIEGKWYFSYDPEFRVGERPPRTDRIKIHETKDTKQEIYVPETRKGKDLFLVDMF